MGNTRKISIHNEKGGTGKTTTAVNLGVGLAQRGKRTLLIDMDAQRHASASLGLTQVVLGADVYSSAHFILGDGDFRPQRDQLVQGFDVLPATLRQNRLEYELLKNVLTAPRKLAKALARVEADYDYILVDCPPSFGLSATMAMVSCPEVLVPVELAPLASLGATGMRDFVQELQNDLEPSIRIMGVVGTFFEEGQKVPAEMLAAIRAIFGSRVFTTVINSSAAIRDASGRGRPIILSDPKHRGAQQYNALVEEVMTRGR